MTLRPITLTITGKVSYEDEISVAQAARIIAFLNADEGGADLGADLAGDHGAGLDDSPRTDSNKSANKVGSAREALDLSGAKTNAEKIVALGEYVLQDGGETFKVEDVKAQFRRARETAPANFSRDMTTAVQAGWLAQGDGDEYYVTNKIQGIFDGGFEFPKAASNGGGRSRGAAKGTAKAKAKPEVFADLDDFPTRMDGIAAYPKMKSDRDRLLWALHFAKSHGIRGLANKDLSWLTDHLGAGVPSGNVGGAFRSGKSAGYMNRSTVDQTIRITEDGEDYLKTIASAAS
ncbi:hypothetical protein [Nocardioides pinisoli]|uniref:Uncharacterized protein n=1 Tax=Nocardioides pinisoli TaxID=2950279 RepID=A0ABT1KS55_9ACTN|nr:hypothetical protein [Nocardioides pinisoli]MCP3420571.1 hypothetical protein [Nocardioides pinisoli]